MEHEWADEVEGGGGEHQVTCDNQHDKIGSCHAITCIMSTGVLASRRVMACGVISLGRQDHMAWHGMAYRVVSCHIVVVVSCRVMSCHVVSCHVMSCHLISSHVG